MYDKPIGVSVLTNGNRLDKLQVCLGSFLGFCYYRPLIVGIFSNGSTDETARWMKEWIPSSSNPWKYGVTFRTQHSDKDLGCASGTNAACELVRDTEFAIHLESDFEHLTSEESGEDRLWLRRAVEYMQEVNGNYMYLRRMTGEHEMINHWWSQWSSQCKQVPDSNFLKCDKFWWSNNPAIRRNKALYDNGTLPLDVSKDGPKGTPGWSKPELTAKAPGNAYIHKWGLFVHDRKIQTCDFSKTKCDSMGGKQCKYGFFKNGRVGDQFCHHCRGGVGFEDMQAHENRFRMGLK